MTTPKRTRARERRAEADSTGDVARVRRSPPARTRPHRNASQVFRANAGRSAPAAEADERASESAPASPAPPPKDGARAAVRNAVDGAYRVLDDYLRWGRIAAEACSAGMPRAGAANAGADAPDAATQWFQLWQSMYQQAWMSWMVPFTPPGAWPGLGGARGPLAPWWPMAPGSSGGFAAPFAGPFSGAPQDARIAPAPPVHVEVGAGRSAKVALRLQRLPRHAEATWHIDGGQPAGLELRWDRDGVHARIGAELPAGRYRGVLMEGAADAPAYARDCGEIVVQVFEAAAMPMGGR